MKALEIEAMEKMEKLIAEAERNPMSKKFREAEAAETLIKRKEAWTKIETLRKKQAEKLPKLQGELDRKEANYLKAKAALDALFDECRTARAAQMNESYRISHEIGQQEEVLIETVSPLIVEAITFFMNKLDELRKPGKINHVGRKSERNLINWQKKTHGESNVQAVHDAIKYCRNAIEELERMKLIPELNLQKIQGLKDNVPSIDIYTESQGTKPMERQAPTLVPPCEFTFKKLLEKAEKHLKTPTPKARI